MNASSGITEADNCDVRVVSSADVELTATRIYEIDPLHDSRWKGLLESHERASVFHSTNWLTALKTAYGYDPFVVTTCSPSAGLTNGIVFCRVRSWLTGRRLVSLPFSDHCEPLVNNSTELDNILLHMAQYVETGGWRYIEIRPTSYEPAPQTRLSRSITYSIHRLYLRKSTQDLFRNFHKDCVQRKIRRAEREKLRYEEGNSETILQKFYDLLVMTRQRQFLPPQPLFWFRALIASFGDSLKIRVASKGDLPIASMLTITHKKSMVFKYGCSNAQFHKFGGVAFLFWNAIRDAREKCLEEFEMGRSDRRNFGLIKFKEHWGAVGTELSYWKYARNAREATGGWQEKLLHRVIPVVPDVAVRRMGELLYRHIG